MSAGSIKKRLCNPPAEQLASSGDPLVLGLFEGAGEALDEIGSYYGDEVRDEFVGKISAIESEYIKGRQTVADKAWSEMYKITSWLLSQKPYKE